MFSWDPEFTERPADVVRCSGPSPLLPPATCSSHTELAAWGPRCGAGKTRWNSLLSPNNFRRKTDFKFKFSHSFIYCPIVKHSETIVPFFCLLWQTSLLTWLTSFVLHYVHLFFCGPSGVSGGRNISAVHPKQSVQRKEGLRWPHPLDGVRAGTHWSQSFWQNHCTSRFRSANMNLFFAVPRPRVRQPLWRQSGANSCQSRLPRGKILQQASACLPSFLINLDALYVTGFQPVHQMGYGSRALQLLQMYYEGKFPTMDESTRSNHNEITSVSSEVIWLNVFRYTWYSFWPIPHMRIKFRDEIRQIKRRILWQKLCCRLLLSRRSVCWRRWSLHGRSSLLCCWSWARGEQRDWTI